MTNLAYGRPVSWEPLKQLLARIEYKPGYWFELRPETASLRIAVKAIDTYDRKTPLLIHHNYPVPWHILDTTYFGDPQDHERAMIRFLCDVRDRTEIHEAREWFRVDGEIYDNPHEVNP